MIRIASSTSSSRHVCATVQSDGAEHYPDCVPALFATLDAFHECETVWIVEHEHSGLEANQMLATIRLVLRFVPLESKHLYLQNSTYKLTSQRASRPSRFRSPVL